MGEELRAGLLAHFENDTSASWQNETFTPRPPVHMQITWSWFALGSQYSFAIMTFATRTPTGKKVPWYVD